MRACVQGLFSYTASAIAATTAHHFTHCPTFLSCSVRTGADLKAARTAYGPSTECNTPCAGDTTQFCGGANAVSLVRLCLRSLRSSSATQCGALPCLAVNDKISCDERTYPQQAQQQCRLLCQPLELAAASSSDCCCWSLPCVVDRSTPSPTQQHLPPAATPQPRSRAATLTAKAATGG